MHSPAGWPVLAAAAILLSGCASAPIRLAGSDASGPRVEPFAVDVAGQQVTGLLAVPEGQPTTLVVLGHPWLRAADTFTDDLRRLADAGVLAVALDYRGAGEDFKVKAGVEDTVAATLALQAEFPSVDRTLLYGWSMGGEVAFLAVAAAPPGTYDYVFDGAGVTDLEALWHAFVAARPAIERETGGPPTQVPDEYRARSPVHRVADLAGKGVSRYFMVHAAGDSPVPVEQAERLYDALSDAGLPVSYYVVTMDQKPFLCTPVVTVCLDSPPKGVANHEAGGLRLMDPFLQHRIDRLPDPAAGAVRGTYDGDAETYDPSDVG
jgi:dipeptidyl aminopeptidase/acylaminoacyl peptidase